MLTVSEIAVTATIWILTAIGCFFGVRAALRGRRSNSSNKKRRAGNPVQ